MNTFLYFLLCNNLCSCTEFRQYYMFGMTCFRVTCDPNCFWHRRPACKPNIPLSPLFFSNQYLINNLKLHSFVTLWSINIDNIHNSIYNEFRRITFCNALSLSVLSSFVLLALSSFPPDCCPSSPVIVHSFVVSSCLFF